MQGSKVLAGHTRRHREHLVRHREHAVRHRELVIILCSETPRGNTREHRGDIDQKHRGELDIRNTPWYETTESSVEHTAGDVNILQAAVIIMALYLDYQQYVAYMYCMILCNGRRKPEISYNVETYM